MRTSPPLITLFNLGLTLAVVLPNCTKEAEQKPAAKPKEAATATTSDIKVAKVLQPYFEDFEKMIKKHKLKIPPDRLAGLKEIVVEEPKEENGSTALGVVGVCYEREYRTANDEVTYENKVAISPERESLLALENVDENTKETVIRLVFFHEMGHCLGGLGHTDPSRPRGKLPVGVMDTYIPSAHIVKSIPWNDLESEFADFWREENP